tara:strand:- start:374 stop:1024 length:651 start_codon:yes stop_codon:yes gene_type:complete
MITNELKKRIVTSVVLLFIIFLVFTYNIILVLSLIILGVLSVLEFFNLTKKIIKNKFYMTISNLFFLVYIFLFCLITFFFFNFPQLKTIFLSILFGCIASDIGGFIFGKIFKGPKLTNISPKKTITGAFGSIFLTTIVFSSIIFYLTKDFSYKIIFASILISFFCQIGDIFFSFLKRKAKVKDTGNFLPGHGGILDRLDGVFLGIPLGFISFMLLY